LHSGPKRRATRTARAEVAPTRAVRALRARGTGPIIATQRKSLNQVIGAGVGLSVFSVRSSCGQNLSTRCAVRPIHNHECATIRGEPIWDLAIVADIKNREIGVFPRLN